MTATSCSSASTSERLPTSLRPALEFFEAGFLCVALLATQGCATTSAPGSVKNQIPPVPAPASLVLENPAPVLESASPKYGPHIVLLRDDPTYLRRAPSPDFWALLPGYVPQSTESACGLAVTTQILNAWIAPATLSFRDRMITQSELLQKLRSSRWKTAFAQGGPGLSLKQFEDLLRDAAKQTGLSLDARAVTARAADLSAIGDFLTALRENEASAEDLVVVNFEQGHVTGDPETRVGHFSVVGAFDEARSRVLVFDVDRDWYEPYWVPTERLWQAMTELDESTQSPRGYIVIRRAKASAARPGPLNPRKPANAGGRASKAPKR